MVTVRLRGAWDSTLVQGMRFWAEVAYKDDSYKGEQHHDISLLFRRLGCPSR
jgi:hypothetical protein